jgi:signal transduction histidine kinase/CheY-like chemotaxis protein
MSRPDAGPPSAPLERRILAEQLRMIIVQTPQGVAGPAALALIGAVVLWDEVATPPLLATLALLLAALGSWLLFYRRYQREQPSPDDVSFWARGTLVRTAAHGCCWGLYSLVVFQADSIVSQSVDVAFMYGLVAGAVVVDGPHFRTFVAFALPTLAPVVVRCFIEGTPASLGVGSAGVVGLAHGLFAARSSYRLTERAIRARLENLELLSELARQKELAELAQRRAEAANREKSAFLAAASHDLRQPIHALSLFVTAASRAGSDAERRQLLERIEASVTSLSTLFDSMLEISRLDAGTLEPRVTRVPLRALLQKLAAEHAAEAREKGLTLRVVARDLVASTDPLLLERLLGNLLANALRYTERGGVLLAARRRGDGARVEVWDTGIGIAPEHQAQVFGAFYQVGNPARERRQGVGLGLAIVERIAALLGHRLELCSRPGRGSCFALELPLSEVLDETEPPPGTGLPPEGAALLGAVLVVLDDDPEVLTACGLLLKSWGARVVSAASVKQAIDRLEADELAPDLVLCDLRLPGAHDGLEAIRALRSKYGAALPAVIVTGDTAEERLAAVAASGLPLLQKPVAASTLARTLGALLRP